MIKLRFMYLELMQHLFYDEINSLNINMHAQKMRIICLTIHAVLCVILW